MTSLDFLPSRRLVDLERHPVNGLDAPGLRAVSDAVREHAHTRALEIRAWHIREPGDLDRAIEAGADGATLDRPEWALRSAAPGP